VNKHQTEEEISVPELILRIQKYFKFLKKRQFVIWLWVASFFTLGILIAINQDDEYQAVNVVLSYSASSSGIGNNQVASRLAGLAGITLPGVQQQGGRVMSELMIPSLLTTFPVANNLGSQPLRFPSEGTVKTGIEYFSEPIDKTLLDYIKSWTVQVPGRVINWILVNLSSKPEPILPLSTFETDVDSITIIPDDTNTSSQNQKADHLFVDARVNFALIELTNRVTITVDMNVITITAIMPDAYAAADLAQHATNILMQEAVNFEIRKTEEELEFLMGLYAESESKYNEALDELSQIQDRIRGVTSTSAGIELTRAQGNAEIARLQFQQITLRVEEARIKLKQDTPMFAVLNPIQIPQRPIKSNPIGLVIVFIFLGIILGVGWVTARGIYDAMIAVANEEATT
jgi:hypothetical protein